MRKEPKRRAVSQRGDRSKPRRTAKVQAVPPPSPTPWEDAPLPGDFEGILTWLAHKSRADLKAWLKDALWQQDSYPLVIPDSSWLPTYLADFFEGQLKKPLAELRRAASAGDARFEELAELDEQLRTLIPELLRDWNEHDSYESLEGLLLLAGLLHFSEAESYIARIATEQLSEWCEALVRDEPDESEQYKIKQDEVTLRQICLKVLSGFCSESLTHIFKGYIADPAYAAICYRALYRIRLRHAATELPELVALYQREQVEETLKKVLEILFFIYLKPGQWIEVLRPLAEYAPPASFKAVWGLLFSMPGLRKTFAQPSEVAAQVEIVTLILKRTHLEDRAQIVRILRLAGVYLAPIPQDQGIDVYFDGADSDKPAAVIKRNTLPDNYGRDLIANFRLPRNFADHLQDQ